MPWAAVFGAAIAPPLLAYAILGQRVMDVGFAINRTLVYGLVSAVLLVGFGLLEWAVEHVLPLEGREKNAFIEAGLALGVFLTFHRVRDTVEQLVERVFFRSGQQREAALKRFLREAPFISRTEALAAAAVQAIRAYCEAPAAIYLADPASGLRRIAGEVDGLAERLDADVAPLVRLRADPQPLSQRSRPMRDAVGSQGYTDLGSAFRLVQRARELSTRSPFARWRTLGAGR